MLPRDLDDAVELYSDPAVMESMPGGPLDRVGVNRLVAKFIETDETLGFSMWPVVTKAERAIIGSCGLIRVPDTTDISIGWTLKRKYWGHGYATEAARAVLRFGFDALKTPCICALIDRQNSRSIAIANRLQMRYDRIVRVMRRDLMRYEKRRE